jgi:GlpG protein
MRRIGHFDRSPEAERFRDYLAARGIAAHLQPHADVINVWILDEDQLAEARQELEQFQAGPRGRGVEERVANYRREQHERIETALAERRAQMAERRRRPRSGIRSAPVTFAVIVLCGLATAATRFGAEERMLDRLLVTQPADDRPGSPRLPEIRRGELWRVITPSLVHFDPLHLVGNACWLYLFGRVLERTRTRSRFILLLVVIAIGTNLAQYFAAGPRFGGLSGINCGLFGYLWFKSHFRPEAGFQLPPEQTILFAGWIIICLTGGAGPVANTAHLAGIVLGVLLAWPKSVPVFR